MSTLVRDVIGRTADIAYTASPAALALAPEAMEPASVAALPDSLATEGATATALRMLRVLHAVNQDHEDARDGNTQVAVNQAAFVNPKLTAKFVRQLEELVVIVR